MSSLVVTKTLSLHLKFSHHLMNSRLLITRERCEGYDNEDTATRHGRGVSEGNEKQQKKELTVSLLIAKLNQVDNEKGVRIVRHLIKTKKARSAG